MSVVLSWLSVMLCCRFVLLAFFALATGAFPLTYTRCPSLGAVFDGMTRFWVCA